MDAPPRLTGQSGAGLLAVVGEGFAVALQDGRTRSAAASPTAGTGLSPAVSPASAYRPARVRGTAQSMLSPAESAAVLPPLRGGAAPLLRRGADAVTRVPCCSRTRRDAAGGRAGAGPAGR
ncbi:hypothetical protein LV779_24010 [Streptomyces thinghirensis]|nr:hypothetical protein [Streptomyces thinghirensis]